MTYLSSFLLVCFLFIIGCSSQQGVVDTTDVISVSQEPPIEDSDALADASVTEESLKLKADLLAFEKENFLNEKIRFEKQKVELLSQLRMRDSLISLRERDLAADVLQLELREQVINEKLTKLEHKESKPRLSEDIGATASKSNKTNRPKRTNTGSFNKRASDLKDFRYIQFVASTGGKTYYQYAYLGQIVTEQIPGKDIYRYKIKGKFDDQQVRDIINTLREEGFAGAFEVK